MSRIAVVLGLVVSLQAGAQERFVVHATGVVDRKATFATVESVDRTVARTRIGGTVASLAVDEGSAVRRGEVLARIEDPKLALERAAARARIDALAAELALARTELERARELRGRGTIPQASLDAARTRFQVVTGQLAAERANLALIDERAREGEVLAPADGRVLQVAVTEGTVVLPGERVADIAVQRYVLRARVPERHARFVHAGDRVWIGPRGMSPQVATATGTVQKVYPEIVAGRVVLDIAAGGIGEYFVGERVRIELGTGTRQVFIVPARYIGQRFGVDYVRLASGQEVVVQRGLPHAEGIEVLAGLSEGDELVPIAAAP